MFEDFIKILNDWVLTIGLPGLFLVSLLSNLVLFIPIPYLLIVFILGSYTDINLVWLTVVSGLGATVAKLIIFSASKQLNRFMGKKSSENLAFAKTLIGKYGSLAVFVISFLPYLDDDALFIPMGLMGYGRVKFFLACLPGKLMLSLIASLGGRYSVPWIRTLVIPDNPIGIVVSIALIFASLFLTFKIDFRKTLIFLHLRAVEVPLKVVVEIPKKVRELAKKAFEEKQKQDKKDFKEKEESNKTDFDEKTSSDRKDFQAQADSNKKDFDEKNVTDERDYKEQRDSDKKDYEEKVDSDAKDFKEKTGSDEQDYKEQKDTDRKDFKEKRDKDKKDFDKDNP
jgi:membrane protein DedA with SNARE-associated domain